MRLLLISNHLNILQAWRVEQGKSNTMIGLLKYLLNKITTLGINITNIYIYIYILTLVIGFNRNQ